MYSEGEGEGVGEGEGGGEGEAGVANKRHFGLRCHQMSLLIDLRLKRTTSGREPAVFSVLGTAGQPKMLANVLCKCAAHERAPFAALPLSV